MAFSSGGSKGPMADINVTPLVDVMLVLLIIFIVTAPIMMTLMSAMGPLLPPLLNAMAYCPFSFVAT